MRSRALPFIAVTLFMLAALALSVTRLLSSGTLISQKVYAPSSFGVASAYGADTMLVAKSSRFLAYNYKTGTTKIVSTDVETGGMDRPDIIMTSADRRYVLFHDLSVIQGSVLFQTLQKNNLDTNSDYWWLYDSKQKTCKPLPANTLLAKLYGNRAYALTYNNDGESIKSYSLDTLSEISSVSIVPSSDFVVTEAGYILQNTNNNVYITKDGVVNQLLSAEASLVTASDDGKHVILAQTSGKNLSIVEVAARNNKRKVLAQGVTTKPAWSASGLLIYSTSNNTTQISTYDTNTGKMVRWKFDKATTTSSTSMIALDPTTAVLTDTNGNIYLLGNGLKTPIKF